MKLSITKRRSASTSISFEGGHESEVHSEFEGGHEAEVGEHVIERKEPDYRNAPLGAFEEELIEGDEEEDIPHPSEVLYEPDSYEEMEEETLERAAMAANELGDELEEDETNGYASDEETARKLSPRKSRSWRHARRHVVLQVRQDSSGRRVQSMTAITVADVVVVVVGDGRSAAVRGESSRVQR